MGLLACNDHWAQLKDQLDQAGCAHLISPTAQEGLDRWSAYTRTAPDLRLQAEFYDALMFAWYRISREFAEQGGAPILGSHDQHICPLCALKDVGMATQWIECAAEDASAQAHLLGVLPPRGKLS